MTELISVADPLATLATVRGELCAAFAEVLDGGQYILGQHVRAFEREWASVCDSACAIGVSSGTDALALALRAVGVTTGDEVLVPAMTAAATWMAVAQIGAVPIGVDIEATRPTIDPRLARRAISGRTRALVAVHLYGHPADVTSLSDLTREAGIALVEDAAQAHGALLDGRMVGSLGEAAAFSFYPTKNLGALGDAGAVTTSDTAVADRVRRLREYGWRNRDDADETGINARLDELQARLLRILLPGLQVRTERRRAIAARYLSGLSGLPDLILPSPADGTEPAWHLFVVNHPRRDALAAKLEGSGVSTAVHYRTAPASYSAFARPANRFPVAERHAATALSLPMHPTLTDDDVARVIAAVHSACETAG